MGASDPAEPGSRTPLTAGEDSPLNPAFWDEVAARQVPGILLHQAGRRGDRTVFHHHQQGVWHETSWTQLAELTLSVAAHLVRLGVDPGDRVALMSENSLEWLYCDFAIQSAGAVTVPIYPSTVAEVAQGILADCQARIAIAGGERIAARLTGAPQLSAILRTDVEIRQWAQHGAPAQHLAEVERRLRRLDPEDLATIVYTSGTTGEPKGVMLPQRCLADMAGSCLKVFDLGPDDVLLSFLPYSHILERMSGIVIGLATGSSAYLSRGMDMLAEDLQEVRPTIMVGVPRLYEKVFNAVGDQVRQQSRLRRAIFRWAVKVGRRHAVLKRPGPLLRAQHALAASLVLSPLHRRITGGRLRFFVSGGAPLSREVESFFWAIGVQILQGWGLTETTSGATSNTEAEHRFETVGKPLPGVQLKLAADGEILVKGPGVMLGYHNRPEANLEAFQEGWFKTGDIGVIDEDGFLSITDRKKDLIKTAGGKYVAPQPLEARLEEDRLIQRAVLIGDERPYVVALVVPDFGGLAAQERIEGDPAALVTDERVRSLIQARIDALNGRLASFETIKHFQLVPFDFTEEAGEITPTLKVKRRVIARRYQGLIEEMYERPPGPDDLA